MVARILRYLLPLLILGSCWEAALWFVRNQEVPKLMEMPQQLVRVDGTALKKTTFPVVAKSQGVVQPRTRSNLLPEVSGMIVEVSANFRPGGFFEKDEALVKIDPVDYQTAVVVSEAALAQAKAALVEEEARAEQALDNWKALGRDGKPGALALREPQLAKARADVASAEAQVTKAKRDLDRTTIRAPYAGQVLEQAVDVGQFVTPGTQLGRVFAVDYVEVRLPLPERELAYLDLPQHFRGEADMNLKGAMVKLLAMEGGRPVLWDARLTRVEGAIDTDTRQTVAVAQIDDPFGRHKEGQPPLKIGQFVEAQVLGKSLENVFVLPRSAVRAGNEIILITSDDRLRRQHVEPLTGDEKNVVISADSKGGPQEGDVLCLTPIPFPADGARVLPTIDGQSELPGVATGPHSKDGAARPAAKGAGRES